MSNHRHDFADVRDKVSLETVCAWIGIELRKQGTQLRSTCPFCKGGKSLCFTVTPEMAMWKCFCGDCPGHGDVTDLVARVGRISKKDAAAEIMAKFAEVSKPADVPEFDADVYASKLESEHEMVQEMGLTPEQAKAARIGFCRKGVLAGRVAIPVKMPDGSTQYMGHNPTKDPAWKLPKF